MYLPYVMCNLVLRCSSYHLCPWFICFSCCHCQSLVCLGMGRDMDSVQLVHFLLFNLLITASIHGNKILPVPSTLQDKLIASSDLITQELFEKYSDIDPTEFWHPHSLTSTTTSRELVRVEKVEKKWIPGKYLEWKYARVGFYHYIIGITTRSIDVLGSDLNKITSIDSNLPLVSLTVFSRWNFEDGNPEIIIPVATLKGIFIYKFANNVITKVNDGWPLEYDIKSLQYCHVGPSTKVVVVPADPNVPINIYNIALNSTSQVWYHQRLPTAGKSFVTVYELGSESYIAIASDLNLIVYGYDNDKGRYSVGQTIGLSFPSTQLVSFSVAYKHYLASVPKLPSAKVEFFGFNGHQYTKEEGIASVEAAELHSLNVEDYRDEHFVLSKKRNDAEIEILAYDGHAFSKDDYKCPGDVCYSKASLEKGVGFTVNDISYYVLPTAEASSQAEVLVISKYTQETVSPLFKESSGIISDLKAIFQRYKRWEGIVTGVKTTLSDALSLSMSNEITGNWDIQTVTVKSMNIEGRKPVEGNPFNNFKLLELGWNDVDFTTKLSDLDNTISQLRDLHEEAKRILKDAIPLNSDRVEVVTALQRVTGSFTTTNLTVDTLIATTINQKDVDAFLASFLLYQRSLKLSSTVRFNGKLTIGNLFTTKLNGILVKDIALLGKQNHFYGDIEFSHVRVNGDLKPARVNGVRFADQVIRAFDISGVRLVDGIVSLKTASLTEPVDSVHITKETFQNLLLSSTNQKAQVPFSFSDIVAEGSVKVTTINGVDFATFLRSIITQEFTGLIRGEKRLKGSFSADSLHIESTLNEFKFPQDLVTTAQKRLQISGVKTFSRLSATKVTAEGLVDGISTSDLVSRLDYDTIRGKWTLGESAVFLNDVTVKGYVDGIKMEDLKHKDTLDQYKSSYFPDADIVFLHPVTFRNLKVTDNINFKKFQETFGGLLTFDGREVRIKGTTTFEKSISGSDAQVTSGKINGIPLEDIFSLTASQNITGDKTFEGDVRFASLYALDTFDGVNLKKLVGDAFKLSKARTVTSKLSFEEIHCSKLKVDGPVNGISNFGESVAVIKGRKEQSFKNPSEIQDFTSGSLRILDNMDVKTGRTIDDLDFSSWSGRRVSLSKEFRTSKPVEIVGNVIARDSCDTRKLNDVLLNYLDSRVLRTDRQQQTFTKKFKTSASIRVENGVVRFEQEVNGFDLNRVFEHAVPIRGKNQVKVTGKWEFESLFVNSELTVEGSTCGVDLAKLDADSLRHGESNVYIVGENTFLSRVDVKEELYVNKVNGDDLMSYLFTLNTDQEVKGKLHFEGNVQLDGELVSTGLINSVSLPWLASVYACENGTIHVLKYDVDGDAVLESTSLTVQNLVQGTDIKKFLLTVVNVNDRGLRITGHKTFTEPITVKGNMAVDTVNGVPVSSLNKIFLTTQNIRFPVPVVFTKGVEAPTLRLTNGDILTHGLVGEFNLTELVEEAAYLNSKESLGTMSIDSVIVEGNVDDVKILNGVKLENVIRLDRAQKLSKLNVKDAILRGRNVEVGGLVCGYNLLEEYQRTLFRNSKRHQVVNGLVTFDGAVDVRGNLVCLNELREDLILLDDGGRITGPVTFTKTTTVESSLKVNGKISGETLEDLSTNYLTNGTMETISGSWTFAGGVTFKGHVTGDGQLDGFHIGELIDQKKAEAIRVENNFTAERKDFDERCQLLDELFRSVSQSPVKLEFFEIHQPSISVAQSIQRITFINAGNVSRLLSSSATCELGSFEFDPATELFKSSYAITRIGNAQQLESVTVGDIGILIARNVQSSCSATEGVSLITLDSSGTFSSKDWVYSGSSSLLSLTKYYDGGVAKAALFILGTDLQTLQLYLWNDSQRQFVLSQELILDEPVIKMKGTPFGNTVGLFYQTGTAARFKLFGSSGSVEVIPQPYQGPGLDVSSADMIQVITTGRSRAFGFLEGRDAFIPSDCTLVVFEITNQRVTIFQRLKAPGLLSIQGISVGNQDFVAFLTKDTGLEVYRYKGLSGFEQIDSSPLRIHGATGMTTFNLRLWKHRLPLPFIAITTPAAVQFLHSVLNGDSVKYDPYLSQALCLIDPLE